jgi:hypothetical protein
LDEQKEKKNEEFISIHSFQKQTLNKMQYHLVFIVLSILYFIINVQSADNTTVVAVVVNGTISVPVTTVQVVVNQTTIPSNMSTTTFVSQKAVGSSYVEPPPHPLGYCIRSRLMCSKIRRCCKGPCNVNNMKCP